MSDDIIDPQIETKQPQNTNDDATTTDEQRGDFFVKELDEKLNTEDVKVAFVFIIDPKSKQPILYCRGTTYQLAKVTVDMAKYFKTRLNQELEV